MISNFRQIDANNVIQNLILLTPINDFQQTTDRPFGLKHPSVLEFIPVNVSVFCMMFKDWIFATWYLQEIISSTELNWIIQN